MQYVEGLARLAEEEDRPMSWMVMQAITEYVKRRQRSRSRHRDTVPAD